MNDTEKHWLSKEWKNDNFMNGEFMKLSFSFCHSLLSQWEWKAFQCHFICLCYTRIDYFLWQWTNIAKNSTQSTMHWFIVAKKNMWKKMVFAVIHVVHPVHCFFSFVSSICKFNDTAYVSLDYWMQIQYIVTHKLV